MVEEVIDLKEVLERVQDDRELLVELLEIFAEDCPAKIKIMREAVQRKDFPSLKDIAHGLKGASGNLSAKRIYASFIEIEQMAKNSDLSNIEKPLKEIDDQLQALKIYAQKLKEELKKAS